MLTSFFSKSKPINFIVVALYMLVFYLFANANTLITGNLWSIVKETGVLLLLITSVFILNFISGRNELTGRNAYKSILFAGFVCMFSAVLENDKIIVANLFILLALRRIISLKSQKATVQKIFDASLWVGVASLFHFWSILFLFLVYFGILVHVGHRFKNWLVPFIALLTLLSLSTAVDLLLTDSFYTISDWYDSISFDFEAYRELPVLIPVAFVLALAAWASFFYMLILQKSSANSKTSLFLILLAAGVAMSIAILAPTKDSSELLFFFAPLSIIVTNYFQHMEDKWFKEILMLAVILLPVALLIFL
jgi:hypothetical protein